MNSQKKIRIGVIGAGWWATFAHIPAVKSHPHAELVAVQSRERAKVEKIARDFGAQHACTTAEELLAIPGLDAVIISTTPNVHYAQTKAALERGLHVRCAHRAVDPIRHAFARAHRPAQAAASAAEGKHDRFPTGCESAGPAKLYRLDRTIIRVD